jgi:hypothetical protein
LVVVQIVEEWGYELGDDACLLEDDTVSTVSPAAEDVFRCDPEASTKVDMLIDQIAKGVSDETHAQDDDTLSVKLLVGSQSKEVAGPSREFKSVLEPVVSTLEASNASIARVAESEMLSVSTGPGQLGKVLRAPVCPPKLVKAGTTQARHRTKSCPPAGRSGLSGPWSLEWLDAHTSGDAGVLFSSKRRPSPGDGVAGDQLKKAVRGHSKTKTGGFCSIQSIVLKGLPVSLSMIDRRYCKSCGRMHGNIDPRGQPVDLVRPNLGLLLKTDIRPLPLIMIGNTGLLCRAVIMRWRKM